MRTISWGRSLTPWWQGQCCREVALWVTMASHTWATVLPQTPNPLQGETSLPSLHGERALGLHHSLLAAPVLQPPRAIDVAQRPADRAALGGI